MFGFYPNQGLLEETDLSGRDDPRQHDESIATERGDPLVERYGWGHVLSPGGVAGRARGAYAWS
ncbi:hypothetical protein D3C87_1639660 [compost metagenome]